MHDGPKRDHRKYERHQNSQRYNECESLEEYEIGEVQKEPRHESGDASTQNTHSHFPIRLPHF